MNTRTNCVSVFDASGDFIKGHGLDYLGKLLDKGVKVALVYGDRDYQCNVSETRSPNVERCPLRMPLFAIRVFF